MTNPTSLPKTSSHPPLSQAIGQVVQLPRELRGQMCHRLRELDIPYNRLANGGNLAVHVDDLISLLLIRSTIQSLTAPQQELRHWLERCWQASFL